MCVWGMALAKGGGVSGKKAALQVKQFDLYPSARNKGWAEVVDLHLLLTTKCSSGSGHHM